MSHDTVGAAPAPKADPETLAIRSRPRRAIRFRRGIIIAIAALGSVSITAVAWMALKPTVLRQVAQEQELSQPGGKAPTDALSSLPSSYGDVPKLGPPLPGDLGRPILERQRQLALEGQGGADPAAQAAAAERERLLAERKAARESGVLVSRNQARSITPAPAATTGPASGTGDTAKIALDPANDPNGQQRKADFVAANDARTGRSARARPGPVALCPLRRERHCRQSYHRPAFRSAGPGDRASDRTSL